MRRPIHQAETEHHTKQHTSSWIKVNTHAVRSSRLRFGSDARKWRDSLSASKAIFRGVVEKSWCRISTIPT